jgi:hypothetical protein
VHDPNALLSIKPANAPWAWQRSDAVTIPRLEEMPRVTQVDPINTSRSLVHRTDQQPGKVDGYSRPLLGSDMSAMVTMLCDMLDIFRSPDRCPFNIRSKRRYVHIERPFHSNGRTVEEVFASRRGRVR